MTDGAGAAPDSGVGAGPDGRARPLTGDLLAAEAAAARYWRSVAEQRRTTAASTTSRPIVRAAIALDRRTAPVQAAVVDTVSRGLRRAAVLAPGLARSPGRAARRRAAAEATTTGAGTVPPADAPPVALLHLGEAPPDLAEAGHAPATVRHLLLAAAARADVPPGTAVAITGPGFAPLTPGWLGALVAAATETGGAVTAVAVHPDRGLLTRTAHDLRIRSAGLTVDLGADGAPLPRARRAGEPPTPRPGRTPVDAATAACLVVAPDAWAAAGGLRALPDPDAALADLALRIRETGRPLEVADDVLVLDSRPVARAAELATGLSAPTAGWAAVVDAHGPVLRRGRRPTGPSTLVLTTAVPSPRLASVWGDWHLARGLADGLRARGHEVRCQTIAEADGAAGRAADVHLVLRGLERVRRTSGQAHVLWLISHPEAVTVDELDEADLVLVASSAHAAHLRLLTRTPVEVVLQAADARTFGPRPPVARHTHPVTVVANSRGVVRRAVADAHAAGIDVALYGSGWRDQQPGATVVADHVAHGDLAVVYSSAGVVLNDHWDTMRTWGYLSNRIFDVAACATPVLSDRVAGIDDVFGDLVPTWSTPSELAALVAELRDRPAEVAARAEEARRLVARAHTLDHRAGEIVSHLAAHGLAEVAP